MIGEHEQGGLTVLLASPVELTAEQCLGSVVVKSRHECEDAAHATVVIPVTARYAEIFSDCPSGKNMCKRGDIILRIAAIDSQRVKLHHLTRVVLVDPGCLSMRVNARRH